MASDSLTKEKRYAGPVGERCSYRLLPIAEAEKPAEGLLDCYHDRYWCVADDCVLLFRGHAPQCNRDRRIAERLCPAWAEVRQLPTIFLRHECET